jgi:hypothetical protein
MSEVQTIEGQRTVVTRRDPPLQKSLPDLLGAMYSVTSRYDITPSGASSLCASRNHPFRTFRDGRHVGTDGIIRDLHLEMCPHCGAVCVRDVTLDRMDGLPIGRGGPRRRNHILGWYSGARPNNRTYTGG